jgi:hypothetical protein
MCPVRCVTYVLGRSNDLYHTRVTRKCKERLAGNQAFLSQIRSTLALLVL